MSVEKPQIGTIVYIKKRPTAGNLNNVTLNLVPLIVTDVYDGGLIDGVAFTSWPHKYGSREQSRVEKGVVFGTDVDQWQYIPSNLDADSLSVADAIAQLDSEDSSLWTSQGKPQVDALENVLGRDVTAKERDEAWDAFQERTSNDS